MSTAAPDRAPIGVLVLRGGRVESWHRVSYAVAGRAGIRHAAGAVDRRIFPRSAVKPLQALPLIESGAARRFEVSAAELALGCASHSG
jgi:L-asparaginase II